MSVSWTLCRVNIIIKKISTLCHLLFHSYLVAISTVVLELCIMSNLIRKQVGIIDLLDLKRCKFNLSNFDLKSKRTDLGNILILRHSPLRNYRLKSDICLLVIRETVQDRKLIVRLCVCMPIICKTVISNKLSEKHVSYILPKISLVEHNCFAYLAN